MKHIQNYTDVYSPDDIQLAHEIAERLDDPGSLTQFLRFAKQYPHDFLKKSLDVACAIPASQIITSRAAIFVNRVNNFRDTNGYTRN
jgi:hypothetical protein